MKKLSVVLIVLLVFASLAFSQSVQQKTNIYQVLNYQEAKVKQKAFNADGSVKQEAIIRQLDDPEKAVVRQYSDAVGSKSKVEQWTNIRQLDGRNWADLKQIANDITKTSGKVIQKADILQNGRHNSAELRQSAKDIKGTGNVKQSADIDQRGTWNEVIMKSYHPDFGQYASNYNGAAIQDTKVYQNGYKNIAKVLQKIQD